MTPKIVTARFLRHLFGGKKWQYLKKVILETIEKTRLEMRRVFFLPKGADYLNQEVML